MTIPLWAVAVGRRARVGAVRLTLIAFLPVAVAASAVISAIFAPVVALIAFAGLSLFIWRSWCETWRDIQ